MRKVIPEQIIMTCDICKKECDDYDRRQEGLIKIRQNALDYLGSPCGDGSVSFDVCDTCLARINGALDIEIRNIRSKTNEAKSV